MRYASGYSVNPQACHRAGIHLRQGRDLWIVGAALVAVVVVKLFLIELFNAGYYWEAHEAWEGLWHAHGRRGATADLIKGLIKLAAAGVKVRERRPRGVITHSRRAASVPVARKRIRPAHSPTPMSSMISLAARERLSVVIPSQTYPNFSVASRIAC